MLQSPCVNLRLNMHGGHRKRKTGRLGGGAGLGAIFLGAALTEVTTVVDPDDVTVIKNYGIPEALVAVSKGCQVCSQNHIRKIDLLFKSILYKNVSFACCHFKFGFTINLQHGGQCGSSQLCTSFVYMLDIQIQSE